MQRVEQAVSRVEALPRGEQGAVRHRDATTRYGSPTSDALPSCALAPKDQAKKRPSEGHGRRSPRRCPRSSSASRASSSTDSAAGSSDSACSSPGESTERLAEISLGTSRQRLSSIERPGGRALRGAHRRRGSADRSSTATRAAAARPDAREDVAGSIAAGACAATSCPSFAPRPRGRRCGLAFRESDRQYGRGPRPALPLTLPDGARMELGAVADFVVRPSDREIKRVNRLTTVVVTRQPRQAARRSTRCTEAASSRS